jgi:hypothetical protein
MLAYEREHGTWATARRFSNTIGEIVYPIDRGGHGQTGMGDDFDNQPIETVAGTLDLDWFTDLTAFGPPIPNPVANQITPLLYWGGKKLWNAIRGYGAEPSADPKEKVAIDAIKSGYNTYAELFPDWFLNQVCHCR